MNKAIADFSKAIKLKSDDAEAYHYRGIAFHLSGIKHKACKDWEKALSLGIEEAKQFLDEYCK
jgi:hypothetical protein